jgi:hypothetical protein
MTLPAGEFAAWQGISGRDAAAVFAVGVADSRRQVRLYRAVARNLAGVVVEMARLRRLNGLD